MIYEMLAQPFMIRAILAGTIMAVLLASLGIFVTLRRLAFFGDGIAHASLAGIALAVIAGFSPLPVALVWGVLVALLIFQLERSGRLPSDTAIGIFFTASMALGVLLMSLTRGYQPELMSYLFGSVLSIRQYDLAVIAGLAVAVLVWLAVAFRDLTFMSLSPDVASVSGVPVARRKATLYVALAVATVLGVKMLGIILISALLILPPAIAMVVARSFRGFVRWTVASSLIMMLGGLTVSYALDLPSGATVVILGTALFFLAGGVGRLAHQA
jgi:ABC-type Mn2+/Zn2+ transport system permease subunit